MVVLYLYSFMQEECILLFKDLLKSFIFFIYYKLPNYPSYPKIYKYFDFYRMLVHQHFFEFLGKNSILRENVRFSHNKNIHIGSNCIIGPNSILNAADTITIGNDFLGGPELIIYTAEHGMENKGIPFYKQANKYAPVIIGNNVYIGVRVTILKGSCIGDNVIVGAGSVITGKLESNAIYVGSPAKLIKKLN